MEINEKVSGMNRYDYLKYEYFVIKCYYEKDPIFCVCDKKTFYYLNCNDNSMNIQSLIKSKYCKIKMAKTSSFNKLIPIICGMDDNKTFIDSENLYETFASAKINKCQSYTNLIDYAFMDKLPDENDKTFRLISPHISLKEAIDDFLNIVKQGTEKQYYLKDNEIIFEK